MRETRIEWFHSDHYQAPNSDGYAEVTRQIREWTGKHPSWRVQSATPTVSSSTVDNQSWTETVITVIFDRNVDMMRHHQEQEAIMSRYYANLIEIGTLVAGESSPLFQTIKDLVLTAIVDAAPGEDEDDAR